MDGLRNRVAINRAKLDDALARLDSIPWVRNLTTLENLRAQLRKTEVQAELLANSWAKLEKAEKVNL